MSIRSPLDLIAYAYRQKVVAPRRWAAWRRKTEPFDHTTADGLSFRLYPPEMIDGHIYVDGIYERRLLQFLARRLSGRIMLDVGANIGNHAIFLADRFRAVHCFEPNPPTVARLRHNIALNHLSNVTVHPIGLGKARADLPYRSNETGNLGGGSFAHEYYPVSATLPVFRGDDYLEEQGIADIDFIKLDVEGFELQVLEGLARTIAACRPVVALEYDGREWGTEMFSQFRDALPGYVFAEAIRVSEAPGAITRLHFAITNGLEPSLTELPQPRSRYYEALLAFPSPEALSRF